MALKDTPKRKKMLFVGLGVLALALVLGGGAALVNNNATINASTDQVDLDTLNTNFTDFTVSTVDKTGKPISVLGDLTPGCDAASGESGATLYQTDATGTTTVTIADNTFGEYKLTAASDTMKTEKCVDLNAASAAKPIVLTLDTAL